MVKRYEMAITVLVRTCPPVNNNFVYERNVLLTNN